MSPYVANFLFESANFLLLVGGLGWALFKPVRKALEDEKTRDAKEREDIERLRSEVDALTEAAKQARAAVDEELEARRKVVLDAAKQQAAGILEEARAAAGAHRAALRDELARTRQAEVVGVAESVGRLAARSVSALLQTLEGPSLDDALVRAACAELESMAARPEGAWVQVEAARPLDDAQRGRIAAALGQPFEPRVVPELGAGVRITTPSGQVDATATSLARRAAVVVRDLATAEVGGEVGSC